MFKKIILTLILFIFASNVFIDQVNAHEGVNYNVNVYFFWGDGCPHCAAEKPFLKELERSNPHIKIYDFEVWKSDANRKLLMETGKKLGVDVSGVPFTVVGDKVFVGFTEVTTKNQIEGRVKFCLTDLCPDSVAAVTGVDPKGSDHRTDGDTSGSNRSGSSSSTVPDKLNLPVLGEVDVKNLSLPIFTIVLGALDGFNPCAMWTLLFLISLLLGMQDRKRMWILGTAFIVSSAFVYFLFMAAWLNLLLFIGFIIWIRIIVSLVALVGGGYNVREYFVNKNAACKVTGGEKRKIVFDKLKTITQNKKFVFAFLGIILLAFAVNLVELVCSAGLPVIFTQILTLSNLPPWQYYAYMVLYIIVFMLDDMIVFVVAMATLKITGISSKYSHYSHLIGGILMIIIGLLLLFKPEILMFG